MKTLLILLALSMLGLVGCEEKPATAYLSGSEIRNITKYFGYVTNFSDSTVSVFSIDRQTKEMEVVETKDVGNNPRNAVVHPNQSFYYVNLTSDDAIGVYSINSATGELTLVETEPAGDYPNGLVFSNDGKFLYLSNEIEGTLFVYAVDSITGELSYSGQYSVGQSPHEVSIYGDYLYVANYGVASNSVSVFLRNSVTGALTIVETQAAGVRPMGMVATDDLSYVFVTNRSSNNIESFAVNDDGSLTSKSTVASDVAPTDAIVSGDYLYSINYTGSSIGIYEIDTATGELNHLEDYTAGTNPTWLIKPSFGDFLIVSNGASDTLDLYGINNNGTLSVVSTDIPVGDAPMSVSVATTTYRE